MILEVLTGNCNGIGVVKNECSPVVKCQILPKLVPGIYLFNPTGCSVSSGAHWPLHLQVSLGI